MTETTGPQIYVYIYIYLFIFIYIYITNTLGPQQLEEGLGVYDIAIQSRNPQNSSLGIHSGPCITGGVWGFRDSVLKVILLMDKILHYPL